MILFGDIFADAVHAAKARNNPEEQERVHRLLNNHYQTIARKESWGDMRDFTQLTWSGSEVQLPADLIGIDLVWDDDYEIEFIKRNRPDTEQDSPSYRYYTRPIGSSLVSVTDGTVSQDNTTLNSPLLTASGETIVGEYFYVDDEPQLYKVTAVDGDNYTFTPGYRGKGTKSSVRITVRPETTQMLQIIAPSDFELPTGTIDLYYWAQPTVLRDDHDIVKLPTAEVLLLKTLRSLPSARQLRPTTDAMVEAALQEALAMNPDKPKPRLVKGVNGRAIDFSQNHYTQRTDADVRTSLLRDRWQASRS